MRLGELSIHDLIVRPKQGGFVMKTSRTLIAVIAIGCTSTIGATGCAGTFMSGSNGTIPTPAQYAAIADDACTGVPARERELGLLAYRDAITSVAPLNEVSFVGKSKVSNTKGAVIGLRATPGISVPWLERVNICHVALVGSGRLVGNDAASDPFVIPGTILSAAEVYAGYALSVRGSNIDSAQEISRRSSVLLSAPAHPPTASLVLP
jgi:hypothetical protein